MFAPLFICALVPEESGSMYTVLISWNGRVYATGYNNKYQLCLVDTYNNAAFVDYFHKVPSISKAVSTNVGDKFTTILANDGKVYGCGSNSVGQIG